MDNNIVELLAVGADDHDLHWLKKSLQAAIKFELSTLPPYLSALWSIKNDLDPISASIGEIAREEMLHMGLVCNMLTAIGGIPLMNTLEEVPIYPGPLPGGINPDLIVSLQGLSLDAVKLFMEIEFPADGPIAITATGDKMLPTIGAFYSAILNAFEKLEPTLQTDHQLQGPLGLTTLATLQDVRNAIGFIVHQGEGSNASPEDTGPGDLAHYYRFGEIYHGRKLQKDVKTSCWSYNGNPVPFPEVWPMARVPEGGYQQSEVLEPEVWQLIQDCDENFTMLLTQLQSSWESGNKDELWGAIRTMLTLRNSAILLIERPLSSGEGNYGPCWRLL